MSQGLVHDLAVGLKVLSRLGGRHQEFGAAVAAFKLRVNHADFTKHIELAVNRGGRSNMRHGHGFRHRQGLALRMAYSNGFKQFFGVKIQSWEFTLALDGMQQG